MLTVVDIQTDFLNSVIVDLQRKNESLQSQLEAAMSLEYKLNTDDELGLKYVTSMCFVAFNYVLRSVHLQEFSLIHLAAVWLSGNALALINVVALRRARLVLGWVTVHGYAILVFNQAT